MKTHQIKTAIRLAFENIKVKKSAFTEEGARIGSIIAPALNKGPGIINRPDWNASLSFRTAKLLNAPSFHRTITVNGKVEEVNFNRHRGGANAYDCMCAA